MDAWEGPGKEEGLHAVTEAGAGGGGGLHVCKKPAMAAASTWCPPSCISGGAVAEFKTKEADGISGLTLLPPRSWSNFEVEENSKVGTGKRFGKELGIAWPSPPHGQRTKETWEAAGSQ